MSNLIDPSDSSESHGHDAENEVKSFRSSTHLDKQLTLASHRTILRALIPTLSDAIYAADQSPTSARRSTFRSHRYTAFPLNPEQLSVPKFTLGEEILSVLTRNGVDADEGDQSQMDQIVLDTVGRLNDMLARLAQISRPRDKRRKRRKQSQRSQAVTADSSNDEDEHNEDGESAAEGVGGENEDLDKLETRSIGTPGRRSKPPPKRWDDILSALSGVVPRPVLSRSLERLEVYFGPMEEVNRRLMYPPIA